MKKICSGSGDGELIVDEDKWWTDGYTRDERERERGEERIK